MARIAEATINRQGLTAIIQQREPGATHMHDVKLGGRAGIDPNYTLDDIAMFWPGEPVILVHGANFALDTFQRARGREPRLVTSATGQISRFTDRETMDDLLAVYAGITNKRLVEGLQARGVNAVGITAMDGAIARGTRKDALRVVEKGKPRVLRGDFAGSLTMIDSTLPMLLLSNGFLPVLTPPALSTNGEAINVDGDKLALRLALALGADVLVILSNTTGLMANLADAASLVREVNVTDESSIESALAAAGGRMKKKVQAGIDAVLAGIPRVVFGDANTERPVTAAISGNGTTFRRGAPIGVLTG